jgi:asparagine synthase (glutamine-hydrolysing)
LLSSRWSGAARILKAPAELRLARFGALIGARGKELPEDLFASETEQPEDLNLPAAFARWHPFAQLQYLDLKLRLANMVIPLVDLPSMAHSLEARVPFLDHELAEFCAAIPPWVKMRGLCEKHVLRRAMHGILPPEICRRRKFGMSAPSLLPPLAESCCRDNDCFNASRVASLAAEHRAGRKDHSRLLLAVFTTQLWNDMFLKAN